MTHLDFTISLIRLSKCKIGMAEASLLFCCKDGATIDQLAKIMKADKVTIRRRGHTLKKKKLLMSVNDMNWFTSYQPTGLGMRIINYVTKPTGE